MERRGVMGAGKVREPLYVCVYVPEFPAQALLRLRPDLARSAVVVLAGDPPLEQVCSANVQAFRLGVMQGMTRAELDSFTGLCAVRQHPSHLVLRFRPLRHPHSLWCWT